MDKYILTRQKIVKFKYSDELKIEEVQKQEKAEEVSQGNFIIYYNYKIPDI